MKLKLSILFLLLFSVPSFSQTSLRGMLLKSNGKPLPYTEIELVPLESKKLVVDARLIAASSTSGKFTFFNVPDGEYTLSINFDDKPTDLSPYPTFFYPKTEKRAEAEIFEVKTGTPLKTIVFQLPPPLLQIKISGKVVDDEGYPVSGVYITLQDLDYDELLSYNYQTDGRGSFTLKGFGKRMYQVIAVQLEKPINSFEPPNPVAIVKSDSFILTANTPKLLLELKETGEVIRRKNKTIGIINFSTKIW